MLDQTIEKYHLNKDQAEIVKNIINYKNKIFSKNLELYDKNLALAINSLCNLAINQHTYMIPVLVDFADHLLECNIEYLKELSKYQAYLTKIIKFWNPLIPDIDYSLFFPYMKDLSIQNENLFVKVVKQTPYLLYDIKWLSKSLCEKCILFVPDAYKYLKFTHVDFDLSKLAIQKDINNIKYVDKSIIEEIIKNM